MRRYRKRAQETQYAIRYFSIAIAILFTQERHVMQFIHQLSSNQFHRYFNYGLIRHFNYGNSAQHGKYNSPRIKYKFAKKVGAGMKSTSTLSGNRSPR